MNLAIPILNKPIQTAVILMTFLAAATAFAIDQPPQDSEQLRPWLVGHLVTDMEALGTFDGNALAKVPTIVNALSDDQVALLAQYYYLTRSKTEQDASLYAMQQQGNTDEQVNAAKAQVADLLTMMNDQTVACYDEFATMPQPVQYLAQVCYASVPGWCCHARCFVPDWYYDNGCYVGPCFNAAYAGGWAVPICNAYHDHGSRFYGRYHNVANTVHINRSTNLAKRDANSLRNHGDLHGTLAHDRLLHQAQVGTTRLAASTQNHVGNHSPAVHSPYTSVAHAGSTQHHPNGNQKPVVHNQAAKPHANHTVVQHPTKAHKQGAKSHAPAQHPAKIHKQAAKTHVNHATAKHAPHPATHASHPKSAAPAQAHAKAGGHSGQKKHR